MNIFRRVPGRYLGATRVCGVLAVAGVMLVAAGCGNRALGSAPGRSAGTAAAATASPQAASSRTGPAPVVTSPAPSAAPAGAGQPSPAGPGPNLAGSFLMDLTWISDQRGWALAAKPCGSGLCPRVVTTFDGGRVWKMLPTPPVASHGVMDVSEIRFATSRVGYLFGPALYQTDNGGGTWRHVRSRPVEALEPSMGTVVRVVYNHSGCPGPCTRWVQETTAGSPTWTTVLRMTPAQAGDGMRAQLVRQGASVIYVPVYGDPASGAGPQHAVIFRSTDGGATWRRLADPCGGSGTSVYDATGLAAAPGGFAAVLCLPRPGTGHGFVLTSADYGSSWGARHPVPGTAMALIAAASPSQLAVATGGSTGSGPFRYRLADSSDGGRLWRTAVTGTGQPNPQAPAVSFLGFEDASYGRWISDPGHIWLTRDGGRNWVRLAFP